MSTAEFSTKELVSQRPCLIENIVYLSVNEKFTRPQKVITRSTRLTLTMDQIKEIQKIPFIEGYDFELVSYFRVYQNIEYLKLEKGQQLPLCDDIGTIRLKLITLAFPLKDAD